MLAMLREAKARGYAAVFLVRPRDLLGKAVAEAMARQRGKSLVVEQPDASLLPAALEWLQTEGGLAVFATHYSGGPERLG